jgi:pimeloyl-ACP methyl ester carboxylesterase
MRLWLIALGALGLGLCSMIAVGPETGTLGSPVIQEIERDVDVGGHRLHMRCTGRGSPTVVIITGLGETHQIWESLIEPLARRTRVCICDRAGYGQSEPGPFPRRAHRVAQELGTLLRSGDLDPPCLLVGHSLGAIHALILAAESPELVAGLVLLDPPPLEHIAGMAFPALQRMAQVETLRLRNMAVEMRSTGEERAAIYFETVASELDSLLDPSADVQHIPEDLGEMPLIVISSETPNPIFGPLAAPVQWLWIGSNREMASRSRRGRFLLARGSGHQIHIDAPETVLQAVFDLLD